MIFLFFGKRTKRSLFYFQKKKRTSHITRARCCCVKMSSSGAATAAATLSGAFGARTRGQKRRRGERDSFSLWDLVVKCDDICFTHVLPRLNATDLKFLYGVNTETRALVKRSTRAEDLETGFKVEEMSSISTLEFVWENKSLWPSGWNETCFCWKVARTNKLELLKWAREEKKCKWDEETINAAAHQGNLEMVKYCVANRVSYRCDACACAARNGHLEYSNTYAKKSKRLGIRILPLGRLKMVISTYSNILLSVSMINMTKMRVVGGRERPLRLFEVLARNRQSALGLLGRTLRAQEQPHRMCTIPPRQRLSSTTRLAIRRMESYTTRKKTRKNNRRGRSSPNILSYI